MALVQKERYNADHTNVWEIWWECTRCEGRINDKSFVFCPWCGVKLRAS